MIDRPVHIRERATTNTGLDGELAARQRQLVRLVLGYDIEDRRRLARIFGSHPHPADR